MRYLKHTTFISVLCCILVMLGGCGNEDETGNESETGNRHVPLIINATTSSFDGLPTTIGKLSTRTPVEDGNTTTFATGDAIGIFAVKDIGTSGGAIADDIDNAKLTYSEGASVTAGSWNPEESTMLYWIDGVNYVAYYPYKEGITIDATKTTDEIIASLAANGNLQPGTDQSDSGGSLANYTASDLMTASGTPTADSGNPARKILTLNFKHQFSLLILETQIYKPCIALTDAGFDYRPGSAIPVKDFNVKSASINSVAACRMSDGTYRVLVKPTTSASQITGNYLTSTDGKKVSFTGSSIAAGFVAGHSYKVEVIRSTHATGYIERALAPGDFYFEDNGKIEIYPGNGPLNNDKIPDYDKAIGIVVTCDPARMTDAKCNAKGWTHAYLMEFYQDNGGSWATTIQEEASIPSVPLGNDKDDVNGVAFDMNGYTETEAMLNARDSEINDISYPIFYRVRNHRISNPIPTGLGDKRSPWFIGSAGQWFDVFTNLGGRSPWTFSKSGGGLTSGYRNEIWNHINSHLQKVDKPLTNATGSKVYFWCSTRYGNQSWRAGFDGTTTSFYAINRDDSWTARAFCPFFAF